MSTPNKTVLWQAILNLEADLARIQASGAGGIGAENGGVPLAGGPFTKINALGTLVAANGGGGVLDLTAVAGAGATQFAFVLRPGGVAAGNVYVDWPTLYAAMSIIAGPKLVEVDNSLGAAHMTAGGPYALHEVTFVPTDIVAASKAASTLRIDNGATIAPGTIDFLNGLTAQYDGVAPAVCMTATVGGQVPIVDVGLESSLVCSASGTTGAFLSVPAGTFGDVVVHDGSNLGGNANAVVNAAGTGMVLALDASVVNAGAVQGAGATVEWDSTIPAAQGAGVTVTQIDGYVPAVPGNWSPAPSQQNTALDQLAARAAGAPGSTFVFQPGGVAAGNVYTTWPALYTALNAAAPASANGTRSPTVVQIDDSFLGAGVHATIPPGAYNLDSVTLTAVANPTGAPFSGSGAGFLDIADGATIVPGARGIVLSIHWLEVTYLGAGPCLSIAGATQEALIDMGQRSTLQSTGAGAFVAVTNGNLALNTLSSVLGDGVHAVVSITAPGTCVVRALANTNTKAAALTGPLTLNWDTSIPAAQGVGVTVVQVNGYVPATPANWEAAPNTQSAGLDQLATKTAAQVFNPVALVAAASPAACLSSPYTPGTGAKGVKVSCNCAGSASLPGTYSARLSNTTGPVNIGPVINVVTDAAGNFQANVDAIDGAGGAVARVYALTLTTGGATVSVPIGSAGFALSDF